MTRPMIELPTKGGSYIVGPAASVQFADHIAIRVINVTPPAPYAEFCWLDVYQIDRRGQATRRRQIYVRPTGLIRTPR